MSYLFVGLLALHIAVGAAIAAFLIRLARRHGKSGLKFSVPIVVGSYLLVFWDVIPTAVVHSYLCRTVAGVTIYQDANEWITAHRSEAANVGPFAGDPLFRITDDRHGYWLNSYFYVEHDSRQVGVLPVFINVDSINDGKTGKTMVEKRWISSGYRQGPLGGVTFSWLKGWVGIGRCYARVAEFDTQFRIYDGLKGEQK